MNKQLINKYKLEFDHWLNDGIVLMGKRNLSNNTIKWYPSITNPFIEISESIIIIIKDEYFTYRKALAEGKTIEYLGQSSNLWQELENANFNLHQTCYRIQPDKPKFKVGDFVRYIHAHTPKALEINNINGDRYYFTNAEMSCIEHELITWTPVKGEWCWFYNNAYNKYSHLAKFNGMWENKFRSTTDTPWQFCEPFLNSMPSYLKDK